MELKNPYTRLFFFSVLFLLEAGILMYYLRKDTHYSSWADFFTGKVFLNAILVLSFSVQAWQAYRATKKGGDEAGK